MLNDLGTNSTTFLSPCQMVKDELHPAATRARPLHQQCCDEPACAAP